jgi:chromate transporter
MIEPGRWSELLRYFLRLGLLGFGGPVALVGQMERELVAERGWLSKEQGSRPSSAWPRLGFCSAGKSAIHC